MDRYVRASGVSTAESFLEDVHRALMASLEVDHDPTELPSKEH